jgi:hypothetical protein
MAAGRRAKANHAGSFVWADQTDADFTSTGADQFLIRAEGGVGIGTNAPEAPLHIMNGSAGTYTASASSTIVTESQSANHISLVTPDHATRGIVFADELSGGAIFYASAVEDGLDFRTNGGILRMVIDSLGRVGIGTQTPAASAKLDISSTTGALLVPRMTTAQRDALAALNGMVIYNSTTNQFNFRENGAWVTK